MPLSDRGSSGTVGSAHSYCPKRLDPGVVRFHGRDWPASYEPCPTMVGAFVLSSLLDVSDPLGAARPRSPKARP